MWLNNECLGLINLISNNEDFDYLLGKYIPFNRVGCLFFPSDFNCEGVTV